jgi:hypothetical protein
MGGGADTIPNRRKYFPFHEIMSETVIVNSLQTTFCKGVWRSKERVWLCGGLKKIFNLNSIPYTL